MYIMRLRVLKGQVGHCESIYWQCVWFGGIGRAL